MSRQAPSELPSAATKRDNRQLAANPRAQRLLCDFGTTSIFTRGRPARVRLSPGELPGTDAARLKGGLLTLADGRVV